MSFKKCFRGSIRMADEETTLDERIDNTWEDLAPHIIRQRLIIEATTRIIAVPEALREYLLLLATATNMQVLSGPHVYSAHELGWGAWIRWRTSGANAYSYPPQHDKPALLTVDTYTCKPFSVSETVRVTREYFNPIKLVYREINQAKL